MPNVVTMTPQELTAAQGEAVREVLLSRIPATLSQMLRRLGRCPLVALATDDAGAVVGFAAIKSPERSYRENVEARSECGPLPRGACELGYLFAPNEQTAADLIARLLDVNGAAALWATAKNDDPTFAVAAAINGFEMKGNAYLGNGSVPVKVLVRSGAGYPVSAETLEAERVAQQAREQAREEAHIDECEADEDEEANLH